MKTTLTCASIAFLFAGCATTEAPAPAAAAPKEATATAGVAYPAGAVKTGSRLVYRSTDRSVRVIGNQDLKDDAALIQSLGNNPNIGIRGN